MQEKNSQSENKEFQNKEPDRCNTSDISIKQPRKSSKERMDEYKKKYALQPLVLPPSPCFTYITKIGFRDLYDENNTDSDDDCFLDFTENESPEQTLLNSVSPLLPKIDKNDSEPIEVCKVILEISPKKNGNIHF